MVPDAADLRLFFLAIDLYLELCGGFSNNLQFSFQNVRSRIKNLAFGYFWLGTANLTYKAAEK